MNGEVAQKRNERWQDDALDEYFDVQPYPDMEVKEGLARETSLTYNQVCNWFSN